MRNKIITAQQAVDLIPDGATIMMGGFVGCGSALSVIDALSKTNKGHFHTIHNDSSKLNGPDGDEYYSWAKMIHNGQIEGYIGSHLGTNPEAVEKWAKGELKVDLVPQGSLAEMIRAGGAGLGGVITPTGVGTLVEDSPLEPENVMTPGILVDYIVIREGK